MKSPLRSVWGDGEVYRAHETTLERDVALKVLPESFAHDPEQLARFEWETKTLASLNPGRATWQAGLSNKRGELPLRFGGAVARRREMDDHQTQNERC